jgi:hypothetical protein
LTTSSTHNNKFLNTVNMKVTLFIIAALSAVTMANPPKKPKKPETCNECAVYFDDCHRVSSSSPLFLTVQFNC